MSEDEFHGVRQISQIISSDHSEFFKNLITSRKVTIVIDVMIDKNIGQKIIIKLDNIFHTIVTGTLSQYHTVAIVTTAHHIASGIWENIGLLLFSILYIKNDQINQTIKKSVKAILYLYRLFFTAFRSSLRKIQYFHTLKILSTLQSLNILNTSLYHENHTNKPIKKGINEITSAIEKKLRINFQENFDRYKRVT